MALMATFTLHIATKMSFMYGFSRNCAASVSFSHSVIGLYIPRIGPHISGIRTGRSIYTVLIVWLQVKVKAGIIFSS